MPTPSAVTSAPRTYASMVSEILAPVVPSKLILKFKRCPTITFSSKEIQELAASYRFTLVGTFWYEKPSMTQAVVDQIGFQGSVKLELLYSSHILIHFDQEPDYLRLFSRQSGTPAGRHIHITKCTPDYDPKIEVPIVPMWVVLLGLPVHFHHKKALFQNMRMFGDPMKLDTAILGGHSPVYWAYMC